MPFRERVLEQPPVAKQHTIALIVTLFIYHVCESHTHSVKSATRGELLKC